MPTTIDIGLDRVRQLADCGCPLPCGCEHLPSGTCCLKCPMPECLLVVEGGPHAMVIRARNERIVAAHAKGQKTASLADRYGLNIRQVRRIVGGKAMGRA